MTDPQRPSGWRPDRLDADVNVHVFTVSAGLVGVCLTVIGIIRIGMNLKPDYSTVADELLALDALCFTAACLLAYASLRSPDLDRTKRLERIADRLFILGMVAMCAVSAMVALAFL